MDDNRINSLWIEKYRPKALDDLMISDNCRKTIDGFGKNIPNLLFCGKQGCGKTSLARILVQDVLKCDYLYVNASDETGVETIRTKVTGFAQTKSFDGNLKVVILDEADFLSNSSQAALRNLMESYSDNTRFILTGNYRYKIIPALQSRCQSLDINMTLAQAFKRCVHVLKTEKIRIPDNQKDNLKNLIKRYFPDLRKCINELQKNCLDGIFKMDVKSETNVLIDKIWKNIQSKKGLETRKFLIENQLSFDSDWDRLLVDLLNFIYTTDIPDPNKKMMVIILADHLEKATRVVDKEINFFACVLKLENFENY